MRKKNIAVVMGGYSTEFEISIQSGQVVCNSLDKNKYQVFPIHILRDEWYYLSEDETKHPINKMDFSFSDGTNTIIPDAVFNTIHGSPGEDGLLQAYLKLIGIPQTSSDFYPAALSFNKRDCLSVLKGFGIKCANSYYVNKGVPFSEEEIVKTVGLPCFVKPNNAGSSFGISKVHDIEKLDTALEIAFEENEEILIESFLDGTEVSVGVIQYKGKVKVLPITEIVSENDFFDYEAKYLGKSQEITPARITPVQEVKVTKAAKHIYNSLNMSGFSRSEFIFIGDEPYFLEMNTVPGMTEASLLPQQAEIAGITLKELITDTIERIK